jgi:PKD repeat protein
MRRTQAAATLALAALLAALVLMPACTSSSLSCNSSAAPTPPPSGPCVADFYGEPTTLNGRGWVHYYQTCTGGADHFYWDFNGDGKTDLIGREASWYYNENGYYSVTLHATGPECDDTITKTDYIEVYGCGT